MTEQVRSLKTGIKYKDTPIGKIPVDWEVVRLEDVSEINMGQSPPSEDCSEEAKGLPFYQGNAQFGSKYPSPKKWCEKPKKIANQGDILISVRAPVGEINIAPHKCCIGRGLAAITAKGVNPDYLYHSLFIHRKALQKIAQGSTFEAINSKELSDLSIFSPPFSEQKQVAEILTTVDEAIEKTAQVIETTKEVKKGLMQKLLTRGIGHKKFKKTEIGEIPEEWSLLTLEEIVPKARGSIKRGPFGGAIKKEFFVPEGYKVYEQRNVIYNDFELGDYYIDEDKFEELKDFQISQDDLLISCSGTIGRIVLVPGNVKKGIINQALLRITLDEEKMMPEFFKHFFETDSMQKKVISHTHGSAMKNIVSMTELKKIQFVVPSIEEQNKIVELINGVDSKVEDEQAYKSDLEELKKGLMQVLLTGKIRVRI